jgi:hypothetical protein
LGFAQTTRQTFNSLAFAGSTMDKLTTFNCGDTVFSAPNQNPRPPQRQ